MDSAFPAAAGLPISEPASCSHQGKLAVVRWRAANARWPDLQLSGERYLLVLTMLDFLVWIGFGHLSERLMVPC